MITTIATSFKASCFTTTCVLIVTESNLEPSYCSPLTLAFLFTAFGCFGALQYNESNVGTEIVDNEDALFNEKGKK